MRCLLLACLLASLHEAYGAPNRFSLAGRLYSVMAQFLRNATGVCARVLALRALCALLLHGFTAAPSARAVVWRVELDGSGDFVTTWDAVWGADAGDTILLGEGRFDTVYRYESHDAEGWDGSVDTYMILHSRNLTVIGRGPAKTVLGGSVLPGIVGIAAVDDYYTDSDAVVAIEDLSVEGAGIGICVFDGDPVIHLKNIELQSCGSGVAARSSESTVTGCLAVNCAYSAFSGIGVLRDSEVRGSLVGVHAYGNSRIERTVFGDCETAVDYSGDRYGVVTPVEFIVSGCDLTEGIEKGFTVRYASTCVFTGNRTVASAVGIAAEQGIVVTGNGNVIDVRGGYVLHGRLGARFDMHGNDFMHADSSFAIGLQGYFQPPAVIHDLTGNWWGGYDATELEARILDGSLSSSVVSFVEFLPMADGPLPVESVSWGKLKALFR